MKKIIMPSEQEIKRFRSLHSVQETAQHFNVKKGVMESWLKLLGLTGKCLPSTLTEHQFNIVAGTLLGDACITNGHNNKKYQYEIKQRIDRIEYVRYIKEQLNPFSSAVRTVKCKKPIKINGHIQRSNIEFCEAARVRTYSSDVFTKFRQKWYEEQHVQPKKVVPKDLKLNWTIVSFWFCDDGTVRHNRKEIGFCTHGFSLEDNEFLLSELEELGVKATINRDNSKYRIRISNKSYLFFMNMINNLIHWDCFYYKILKK